MKILDVASLTSNPYLRDIIIRRCLQKLEGIGVKATDAIPEVKILRYLKQWVFTFCKKTKLWSMKTAAGFFESAPGYSAYVSNRLEAFWNKLDALVSQPEEYMMLDALLKELRSIHVGWQKDFAFSEFLHFPGGRNFFAPRVMEGEGQ